jgi:hypothetical protein
VKLTEEQIKAMADRAEARARGKTDEHIKASEFVGNAVLEGLIDAEVKRLASLSPSVYETQRVSCARRLKLRTSHLDHRVREQRKKEREAKKPAAAGNADELGRGADHIIKHPDILDLFAKEFAKVIAGEEANGRLLYLIGTSRVFDKPMNAVIKGTSAGGKSEIRKRILEFFRRKMSSVSSASVKSP